MEKPQWLHGETLQTQGWFGRWLSTPFSHPVGVLASNRGYQQVTIPDKDAIIHRGSS